MNNKLIFVVLAVVVLGGAYVLLGNKPQQSQPTQQATENANQMVETSGSTGTNETTGASGAMEGAKTYTMADIEKHATKEDCWFAIEDKVYDVTKFIESEKHAGGEAIVYGCGKDATEMFNNRASDGKPHSDKARSFLPNFEIGVLAE